MSTTTEGQRPGVPPLPAGVVKPTFSASARLDRLPITSLHRIAVAALAFAYFFELADLNTFAYAAPGVRQAWNIPNSAIALITSASFGGMFIGAVFGGRFSDAFGRKRGFIISIFVYAVFSFLNALSWDVASLAIFRFLTGVGLSGRAGALSTSHASRTSAAPSRSARTASATVSPEDRRSTGSSHDRPQFRLAA